LRFLMSCLQRRCLRTRSRQKDSPCGGYLLSLEWAVLLGNVVFGLGSGPRRGLFIGHRETGRRQRLSGIPLLVVLQTA